MTDLEPLPRHDFDRHHYGTCVLLDAMATDYAKEVRGHADLQHVADFLDSLGSYLDLNNLHLHLETDTKREMHHIAQSKAESKARRVRLVPEDEPGAG